MTRQRDDQHSTEFGIWLRQQSAIDSKLGFVTTNLDYIWENYHTGEWMMIEEKRHGSSVSYSQGKQFDRLKNACKSEKGYKGFHVLVFQNTSPEDGNIFLDGKMISKEQLISFLQFKPY